MTVKRHRFITPVGAAKAAISLGILGLGWIPLHAAGDAMMTAWLIAAAMFLVGTFGAGALVKRQRLTANRWSCPPHASGRQVAEMKALISSYGFLAVIGILSLIAFLTSHWLPETWADLTFLVRQISSVTVAGAIFAQSMLIVRRDRLLAALSR